MEQLAAAQARVAALNGRLDRLDDIRAHAKASSAFRSALHGALPAASAATAAATDACAACEALLPSSSAAHGALSRVGTAGRSGRVLVFERG